MNLSDLQQPAWGRAEFEARLRDKGKAYHIHHPMNVLLNGGGASREQIRGWVANRFYYQIAIPVKDAAILSNCPDRKVRRLGVAAGLTREEILDLRHVVPGVRFAVDAYVNFARRAPWQEAVCSSLTELFAPEIHKQRLANWPQHYPWIEPTGLQYFRNRVSQARRDVEQGLEVTLDHFNTRPLQERALQVLQFKLDVLWSMNDAMALRYGVRM
jgi:pyrroloquinoline-quinone synthase